MEKFTVKDSKGMLLEIPVEGYVNAKNNNNEGFVKLLYYLRGIDSDVTVLLSDNSEEVVPSIFVFSNELSKQKIDEIASNLLIEEYTGSESDFLTFCYPVDEIKNVETQYLYKLVY